MRVTSSRAGVFTCISVIIEKYFDSLLQNRGFLFSFCFVSFLVPFLSTFLLSFFLINVVRKADINNLLKIKMPIIPKIYNYENIK